MSGTEVKERENKVGSLVQNAYGKSGVRLAKIIREKNRHVIKEMTVAVKLEGDFKDTYLTGDNSKVVATDSMKNTVYVIAHNHPLDHIEGFAKSLAEHFLKTYAHVSNVKIEIEEDLWSRIETQDKPHEHSFVSAGNEKRVTSVWSNRDKTGVESGVAGLLVLKTTASEFSGFVRDTYTTLADATDRIFATTIDARWPYKKDSLDFNANYEKIRRSMLDVFARHHSLSVQQTLYEMGEEALKVSNEIDEISISMPNQHRIPFNLQPFGLENKNEIFVPIDEPFGLIQGTIRRASK